MRRAILIQPMNGYVERHEFGAYCPKCRCFGVLHEEMEDIDVGVGIDRHTIGFWCDNCDGIGLCHACGAFDCHPHASWCELLKEMDWSNSRLVENEHNNTPCRVISGEKLPAVMWDRRHPELVAAREKEWARQQRSGARVHYAMGEVLSAADATRMEYRKPIEPGALEDSIRVNGVTYMRTGWREWVVNVEVPWRRERRLAAEKVEAALTKDVENEDTIFKLNGPLSALGNAMITANQSMRGATPTGQLFVASCTTK